MFDSSRLRTTLVTKQSNFETEHVGSSKHALIAQMICLNFAHSFLTLYRGSKSAKFGLNFCSSSVPRISKESNKSENLKQTWGASISDGSPPKIWFSLVTPSLRKLGDYFVPKERAAKNSWIFQLVQRLGAKSILSLNYGEVAEQTPWTRLDQTPIYLHFLYLIVRH